MVDADLQQGAGVGVERGFPQLVGVHFTQTLIALDFQALAAAVEHGFQQAAWSVHGHFAALVLTQDGGLVVHFGEAGRTLGEALGVLAGDQGRGQRNGLVHAAHRALKDERAFDKPAGPCVFAFFGEAVQAFGGLGGFVFACAGGN